MKTKSRFNLQSQRRDLDLSPKQAFEKELAYFESSRGHELDPYYTEHTTDYAYCLPDFINRLDSAISAHELAERLRADLRSGRRPINDPMVLTRNAHPAAILRIIAAFAGWRIVPLARWVSLRINDHSFAFEVEEAYREWVEQADAVWSLLAEYPDTRIYRESSEANMRPLIHKVRKLTAQVARWVEDYDGSGLLAAAG